MRKTSVLGSLFPQVRQGVLAATLTQMAVSLAIRAQFGHESVQSSARANGVAIGGDIEAANGGGEPVALKVMGDGFSDRVEVICRECDYAGA
jgi:hypothetical protein